MQKCCGMTHGYEHETSRSMGMCRSMGIGRGVGIGIENVIGRYIGKTNTN